MPDQETRESILTAIRSLQRLSDLFRERRRQLARGVGLNETEWRLLEEIAGEGFMPSLFARRQDCAPSAVSRTLRPLLDRELIAVTISPDDARQRIYRLTSAGRRILERLQRNRERAIATIWEPFSQGELSEFTCFAGALIERLQGYRARKA